jgi:uncharacterized SAM-binding protein YcdF (DUF218 family)
VRWLVTGLFVVLVATLYLGRASLFTRAAQFLDVSEPPEDTDYVLVLGGGSDTRPFVAAALVNAGLAHKVLVPRVQQSPEVEHGLLPAEQDLTSRVLRARGVLSRDIILLDGECASTRDEALALGRFLDDRPNETVMVVTTTYHTRRARGIFRSILGERASRLRFVAAPTDGFDAHNWWQFEEGFVTYTNEYVKLALSQFRD